MQTVDLAFTIGAGTVLVLGLVAGYVKNRLWVAEPVICLAVGILIGPAMSQILTPTELGLKPTPQLEQVAHLTLSVAVMGAALRLPSGYVLREWRSLAIALVLGLPAMAAAGAGIAAVVFGLSLLPALMVGTVLAPTDPVVASSIASGRAAEDHLPARTRYFLTAESGANDGLGLMLVLLPVFLASQPADVAWNEWISRVLIWEVLAAVLIGTVCGEVAGRLLLWAIRQPFSDAHSITTISLALSLTVLFAVRLIGSDGILAVFTAGLLLKRHLAMVDTLHEHTQEAIGRFFDLPVFVLFGTMLPWSDWMDMGWKGLAFAGAVLTFRRLPIWLVFAPLMPAVKRPRESLFLGWFGPMGIASIYYALLVSERTEFDQVWPIVSLVVSASILSHGVAATPLTQLMGRLQAREGN